METATNNKLIHKKLADIMKDVPAIGKNQKNRQQGFSFRGIQDIYDHLQPVFARHGVYSMPEILNYEKSERETKSGTKMHHILATIKYTFVAEDGSCVSTVVLGEGLDMGDKAANKAMSVAHKYAITQILALPFSEVDDPDAESPAYEKPTQTRAPAPSGEWVFPYGKHAGKTIAEVGLKDAYSYCTWKMNDLEKKGESADEETKEMFNQVRTAYANKAS